jgi:hypothetical protein
MDTPITADARPRKARRSPRAARALVAASITGAVAVAGVASAGAASAATIDAKATARPVDPALADLLRPPFPGGGGGCIVCGLGGFDPIFEPPTGPIGF